MTDNDRFFTLIGKAMMVFALLVVMALVGYSLKRLYEADQSYLHDDTPLLAPDTTRKAVKP
jgi:hypothetical protein